MTRCLLALALTACLSPLEPEVVPKDEWDHKLDERVVDYSAALRIAALRLTGELPTLAEIVQVASAEGDAKRAAYEGLVSSYIASPRFARQMLLFWQDTLKLGDDPRLDSAAAFVAQLVVENRPFTEALTATTDTCPTFDSITGRFQPAACGNTPQTAGLLTHPGMQAHFFGNFGFRRVRWVQETFACTKFPAELAQFAIDVGADTPYTGAFPFDSIAGKSNGGRIDFLERSAVLCANCHSNMNHIAPLFAFYDAAGQWQPEMMVPTPLPDNVPARMGDYLPPGERLAWRFGVPITDMRSLGTVMAADPAIAQCAIARVWNWAMGKTDIVDGGSRVPLATIEPHVAAFTANQHRLRDAIFAVFTGADFVRF
ncbi:MAG TPA: hypothetical protein VIU61_06925 [Kofleriaceae bacterium]